MQANLVIPATLEALEQITPFVHGLMADEPSLLRTQVALAVHELCMNIVQHGYAGAPGQIELQADYADHEVRFHVVDRAPNAFNPIREVAAMDPESLPERGWGLLILSQVIDEVAYSRQDSASTWRLSKRRPDGNGTV